MKKAVIRITYKGKTEGLDVLDYVKYFDYKDARKKGKIETKGFKVTVRVI